MMLRPVRQMGALLVGWALVLLAARGASAWAQEAAPKAGEEKPPEERPPVERPPVERPLPIPRNLTGRGLLELHDPFPLALLHLQLPINTLEVIEKGHGKIDANITWSNSFAIDDSFVVDAETLRFELGGWYALLDDFYLGASLPVMARGGGVLDPLVEGFHEAFGFSDRQRLERPQNDYELSITEEDGDRHELDSGVGLGDLVLKMHWNLNPGDQFFPAVALQGLVGLPTSMPGYGTDGVDLGLSVSFYKTLFKRWHLHGMLGACFFIDPVTEGFPYEKEIYQAAGGIEYAVLDRLSLIFQVMTYGPLMEGPRPLDVRRVYLAWGFKWEFLKEVQLEFSLVENIAPFENTADISFSTGFSFRL